MLWKRSKAESEVISEASKQTKNILLCSGKNKRVGESLQKTFTLRSSFLNLQVWSATNSPSVAVAGGHGRCGQAVEKASQPAFLLGSHCKGMAAGMWFPRWPYGCNPEEMLMMMMTMMLLWAGSCPKPLPLRALPGPSHPPPRQLLLGWKQQKANLYLKKRKKENTSLPVELSEGRDQIDAGRGGGGKAGGREAGLPLQ